MDLVGGLKRRMRRAAVAVFRTTLREGWFAPDTSRGAESDDHAKVVMCLWNRPDRLEPVLAMLRGQVGTAGVDLYLWNNAKHDHAFYTRIVRETELGGALRSVNLVRTPLNLGSMARFYWVRKLARRGYGGPVIIVDDDEDVSPDFVAGCLQQYSADSLTAWWAFEVRGGYWERTPAEIGGPVDHIGPGGMVCSATIFLDRAFFDDLPEKYWFLDDLWLSHYAKSVGLRLRKLDADISFVLEDTNQYPALIGLKVEFYEYLRTRR